VARCVRLDVYVFRVPLLVVSRFAKQQGYISGLPPYQIYYDFGSIDNTGDQYVYGLLR